jgi:hypothetical protein
MTNLKFKPFINSFFVHIPKCAGMTIYDSVLDLDRYLVGFLDLSLMKNKINQYVNLKIQVQ